MPSFINIGAFVDEGTMVDTWVTGWIHVRKLEKIAIYQVVLELEGVLEPMQANPTIIEDNVL